MKKSAIEQIAAFKKSNPTPKKAKRSKYNSEKCNGYDSKKESGRGSQLELYEKLGAIRNLRKQVPYLLCPAQYVMGYKGKLVCVRRELKYIADFVYDKDEDKNEIEVVEDAKGFRTKEYKHKANLMKKLFGIIILET